MFYILNTEEEAITLESLIVTRIRSWVETYSPISIADTNDALLGRKPRTGELASALTNKWDTPRQRIDGKWILSVPTQLSLGPIPLSVITDNITAPTANYDTTWFPEPETDANATIITPEST